LLNAIVANDSIVRGEKAFEILDYLKFIEKHLSFLTYAVAIRVLTMGFDGRFLLEQDC